MEEPPGRRSYATKQLGVRHFGVFLCQPDAAYHQFLCELFSVVVRKAEAQPNFHERLQQVKDEGRAAADERRKLGMCDSCKPPSY